MNRREFVVGAASLLLAPRALANTRSPVALVTADEESRLVAVDLATGRILRHITTLASPRSIEAVGETAVVAHTEIGALSVVRGFKVAHVLRGFDEPRYTAAHPDGRHAYVTDAARGELVALDVVRGAERARGTSRSRRADARSGLHSGRRRPTLQSSMPPAARGRASCARSGRRSSRTTSAGR